MTRCCGSKKCEGESRSITESIRWGCLIKMPSTRRSASISQGTRGLSCESTIVLIGVQFLPPLDPFGAHALVCGRVGRSFQRVIALGPAFVARKHPRRPLLFVQVRQGADAVVVPVAQDPLEVRDSRHLRRTNRLFDRQ